MRQEERKKCFDRLIDENLTMFRSVAFRMLGKAEDADDVVQESLLCAWTRFDSFKQESKLSSWVYRIIVNRSCNFLRKKKYENETLHRYPDNQPESSSGSDVQISRMKRAIAKLDEKYRQAIMIGCLSGLSMEKAAEILDCSVNNLYQRIHRAKEMVKKTMEKGTDL